MNVAGLLTGQDLYAQLKDRDLGDALLIPCVTLRQQEDVFLDDMSVGELSQKLGVPVIPVINQGQHLLDAITGRDT